MRFTPSGAGSQADCCDHGDVRRPAALVNGVEKLLHLIVVQIGQLPLLDAERTHPDEGVRVVDFLQLEQNVEHRAQIREPVVQRLRVCSVFEH
ncbi:hypothetical protein D3C84_1030670 [compost metagenome]